MCRLAALSLADVFLHCKCLNRIRHTHGSNWQQGVEQNCRHSVPLTQDR